VQVFSFRKSECKFSIRQGIPMASPFEKGD